MEISKIIKLNFWPFNIKRKKEDEKKRKKKILISWLIPTSILLIGGATAAGLILGNVDNRKIWTFTKKEDVLRFILRNPEFIHKDSFLYGNASELYNFFCIDANTTNSRFKKDLVLPMNICLGQVYGFYAKAFIPISDDIDTWGNINDNTLTGAIRMKYNSKSWTLDFIDDIVQQILYRDMVSGQPTVKVLSAIRIKQGSWIKFTSSKNEYKENWHLSYWNEMDSENATIEKSFDLNAIKYLRLVADEDKGAEAFCFYKKNQIDANDYFFFHLLTLQYPNIIADK